MTPSTESQSQAPRSPGTASSGDGLSSSEQPALVQALREVLAQGLDLCGAVDAGVYAAPPAGLSSSGVGPHLRHTLDFVRRFLDGLSAGRIDYDMRARDPLEEVDPQHAKASLQILLNRLDALTDFDPTESVQVRHDVPAALIACADPSDRPWTSSSRGRELLFVLSHTIHHYALMAMSLRHHGVDPGPEFGVAPSTLRYWADEGVARVTPGARG